jgi:hypothetical protein
MENFGPSLALFFSIAGFLILQYLIIMVVDGIYQVVDHSIERSSSDPKSARGWVDILTLVAILFLLVGVYSLNSDTGGPFGYIKNIVDIQATKVGLFFATDTPTPTQTKTSTPTPLQTPTCTPTPTQMLTSTSAPASSVIPDPTTEPTSTFVPISQNKVVASLTTEQELKKLETIWNAFDLIPDIDPENPNQSFDIPIDSSSQYRWPIKWCATNMQGLQDNLKGMSVEFSIDGLSVPKNMILEYETSSKDWQCHYWVTTLSNWKANSEISLAIRIDFHSYLNDGVKVYPEGAYIIQLKASVFPGPASD